MLFYRLEHPRFLSVMTLEPIPLDPEGQLYLTLFSRHVWQMISGKEVTLSSSYYTDIKYNPDKWQSRKRSAGPAVGKQKVSSANLFFKLIYFYFMHMSVLPARMFV